MGLQRIIIDCWTTPDHAVFLARHAIKPIQRVASVSEAKVIEHPGQFDERIHGVYSVGLGQASPSGPVESGATGPGPDATPSGGADPA